ncbi:MAG: cation transporter [Clostridia bacterium]|nr:cation transporter [Clostridia bacterium]
MLAGILGIVLNVLLCIGKLFAGTLTGSIAITADAVNNLSDAGSSVITLIGFKFAAKKPDPHHPFGHGRAEYLAGLAVSLVILLMGFELLKSSVSKILTPEPVTFQPVSAAILIISAFVKLYMSAFNRTLGKKLDSLSMQATSADCRSDALATSVVFITMLIAHFTGANIDGWAGLLVSFTIFWAGFTAAKETINPLLGQAPDPELVEEIRDEVMSDPNVSGIHDLIVHDYGPGRRMVSLHAEVPADGDILALHDAIDRLERHLGEEHGCQTVIHMDPIITNDEHVAPLKKRITERIQAEIDPGIQLHDFRIVTGPTHTNIIFDAVVPYNFRMADPELKKAIASLIKALDETYFAVVTIDHQYT